jgi:hypothetical protein
VRLDLSGAFVVNRREGVECRVPVGAIVGWPVRIVRADKSSGIPPEPDRALRVRFEPLDSGRGLLSNSNSRMSTDLPIRTSRLPTSRSKKPNYLPQPNMWTPSSTISR